MSASQHLSVPQRIQMSVPARGELVHRSASRIELTLLIVGVLAIIAAVIPFVE